MATIMEKDSLIHLIAYATSIIVLRLERSQEYEKVANFLAEKRNWIYSTSPSKIDLNAEIPALQEIIRKYEHLPILPQFQINESSDNNLKQGVDKKFQAIWLELTRNHQPTPQENPIAVILGGQPGAGKSFGIENAKQMLNNNTIIINGDEFRVYKQSYNDIYQQYGSDTAKYTGDIASAMVQKVRDEAIKNKHNIIIEGTFRTVEVPLKEIENFQKHGYEVDVIICTCPKNVSWESTIERGDNDKKLAIIPRYTPKEHHDLVVETLPKNADTIFQLKKARNFTVYSRTEKIFDYYTDKNKLPSNAINHELSNE